MDIYVTANGEKRRVKAVWKGSADGTPIKLEEGTPEYLEAVRYAARQGVLTYGT